MKRLAFVLCALFAVSSLAVASAASPPRIDSTKAFTVGSTTTGLNVIVDTFGLSGVAVFQISEHSDMSALRVANESKLTAYPGLRNKNVSVTGLQPDRTYWFRVVITTDAGDAKSGIGQFRTTADLARPPTVTFNNIQPYGNRVFVWFICNAGGIPFTFQARWSRSPDMSGAIDLGAKRSEGAYASGLNVGPEFLLSTVPNNTRVYFQAEVTSANGTARSAVHEFLAHEPI